MQDNHLKADLIDPDKLIKVNDLKEISNPAFFERNFSPTPNGLLSNEIFGITKYDRSNTFAYIDLYENFINPLIYKTWCKLDSNIKPCIHGLKRYSINDKGELVEDPENGKCGVKFLQQNISKIKIKRTESRQRDMRATFIERYIGKPEMFISKMIVCPAFYRDVNTEKGKTSVGAINELYRNLIISVSALRESSDYGLNLSDATRGRIQETLVQIYDYFGSGTDVGGETTPNVIPGKTGILRRAVMSKTTDYASRLVLSAPELKVESLDDLGADLDYSVLPLASACVNFLPFVIYNVRRFFENEFSGDAVLPYKNPNTGEIEYLHPKDYQIEFSDEKIKKEIDKFVTGFSNRFIPIEVPTMEGITCKLRFKGYGMTPEEFAKTEEGKLPIMERDLTWLDILYQAAVESVKDKHILINRYPIDTYFNIFSTKVKVSSTVETEPMIINNTFYKTYPKIRQEDIGTNTSNKFIDTLNISNLYLEGCGGKNHQVASTLKHLSNCWKLLRAS